MFDQWLEETKRGREGEREGGRKGEREGGREREREGERECKLSRNKCLYRNSCVIVKLSLTKLGNPT